MSPLRSNLSISSSELTASNQMDDNLPFFDLYLKDYLERLEFARHNGCNTVMLTGNSEPQQNRKFLTYFGMFMQMMRDPFQWIEMQTTGAGIDRNYLRFLRNHVRISLISLSISSLSSSRNAEIIGCPKNMVPNLADLSRGIKEYDFSLRFSLNLTDEFDKFADDPEALISLFSPSFAIQSASTTTDIPFRLYFFAPYGSVPRSSPCVRTCWVMAWMVWGLAA